MSRHQAAAHFGVGASPAIRWVALSRATGSAAPGKIGGYKLRTIRDEHAAWLVARCPAGAFTLRGLVTELSAVRGLKVDYRSVWEFVHAEGLGFKKKPVRQRAGAA